MRRFPSSTPAGGDRREPGTAAVVLAVVVVLAGRVAVAGAAVARAVQRWAVVAGREAVRVAPIAGQRVVLVARRAGTLAGQARRAGATAAVRLALVLTVAEVALRRALPPARRATGGVLRGTADALSAGPTVRVLQAGARAVAVAVLAAGLASFAAGPALRLSARPVQGRLDPLPPLAVRSVVVARDGAPLAVFERENRELVRLDDLPPHVPAVVLAAEDRRFWRHDGFDVGGVVRAALRNLSEGTVTQGGSTITQQLAKQNFVGTERTLARKAEELLYAVALEDRFSKRELLERYLNQAYFGSRAYGIEAAAEEYFHVAARDLTVAQAATLAAVIRAPSVLDPRRNPDAVLARRDRVIAAAARAGLLDTAAARAAHREPLGVQPAPLPRPRDPVADAVRAELLGLDALGATPEARARTIDAAGVRIETTIDPRLQQVARDLVAQRFPNAGPTAAVAAVEPTTGAIRVLHGGSAAAGGFDLARQARRQPGSAFKPLAAVAALEAGAAPDQPLEGDGPIELHYGGAEPWVVDNYEGRDAGTVDMREALVDSINTAFAQLGVAVGADAIAAVAERTGVDAEAALGPPFSRGPSVALGGVTAGVSPLELATAYATLAAGGARPHPHLVERVVAPGGRVLYEHDAAAEPAIDPAVAGAVVDMLQDVVAEGTGTGARLPGWEPMGKTGTSQDAADAWFVGAVPDLAAAVWAGHPDRRDPMDRATGGTVAAPLWRGLMVAALDGVPPRPFPPAPPLPPRAGLDLPRPTHAGD